MKKLIFTTTIFISILNLNAQDLISGGSNSWIFHTPDDGRTSLHIAPKINGKWEWKKRFEIGNDGALMRFLHVRNGSRIDGGIFTKGDLIFEGGNDWILHTPGTKQGSLHFAFKTNGSWNWYKQIFFTKNADVIVDGKIGIGSRNPDSKLTVKGKIHCEEVKVDLQVPADYVFEKYYTGTSTLKEDYQMLSLEEVEAFTKKNNHLPEIPSAKEIQKEGLHLKKMTNLLLQKIEELTLYTIEQEKRIKVLEELLNSKKQ